MEIVKERVYEHEQTQGYRILVDRVWPRGIRKEDLSLDLWAKKVTPSPSLRKWFNHEPDKFSEFQEKYRAELIDSKEVEIFIHDIAQIEGTIVFIYAAKDPVHNHVNVLINYIKEYLKGT